MDRDVQRLVVAIVRPPFIVIRAILGPLWSLAFGWADRRAAARNETQLLKEVEAELGFLFIEYGGIVTKNVPPTQPIFDAAVVVVKLNQFYLKISRCRGDLEVHVAPAFSPNDWHELALVLRSLDTVECPQEGRLFSNLWEVARLMAPKMRALTGLFTPGEFSELKGKLETEVYTRDRLDIHAFETELNRRLYGE